MRLGFDARMYGLEHAGIGRYVINVLERLIQQKDLSIVLFVTPKYADQFKSMANVEVVETSIRHYSLAEQTQFLQLVNHHHFDLFHVPHFNLPFFYHRPFVVTIHDILWHQVRGAKVTTLSPPQYYLKYQGYKLIVNHAISQSKAILVPSNFVKQEILSTFPRIKPQKIHVTYEGVGFTSKKSPIVSPSPFLIYVGSAYPHKNLPVLLQALVKLDFKLKLVGSRSIFLDQVRHQATQLGVSHKIEYVGSLPDAELTELLSQATALVHPSKSEGFGLTGLEAMAAGCPVIAAKATALPEIYGDAAVFFDPDNPDDLIAKVNTLTTTPQLRLDLIEKGFDQIKRYSWDKMVEQTLAVYNQVI